MEGALEHDIVDQVPVGLFHFQQRAILDQAGVVDQHIDATERFAPRGHHGLDFGRVADVGLYADGLAAGGLDGAGGLAGSVAVKVGHNHGHAFGGQHACRLGADATSRSGHYGDTVL
ncbi:hypothetical protein D9M70_562090 [compost metagenome]